MSESQTIGKLAEALSKAQSELGPVKKGADNPFFKSKYATLSDAIDVVREPLANHGLSFIQYLEDMGDTTYLVTKLMHSSGEWVSGQIRLILAKRDMQGLGSAITYAKRYGLIAMVGLGEEDDDGHHASHNDRDENSLSHPKIIPKVMDKKSRLENLMMRSGWSKLTLEYEIDKISNSKTKRASELTDQQFEDLCRMMTNEIQMSELK